MFISGRFPNEIKTEKNCVIITGKTYKQGSYIPVIVDITANHQGYFIFKLCQNNDIFQDPKQSCFDQMPLWVGGGDPKFNHTRFPIHDYETGPILDRKKAKIILIPSASRNLLNCSNLW